MEAALEENVRRDLDATTPYLVLGDWYLERGDPRGHLIQLHHQASLLDDEPERQRALLEEADAWFDAHAALLLGPLQPHWDCVRVEWRCGFFRTVEIFFAKPPLTVTEVVRAAMRAPLARFVRRLVIATGSEDDEPRIIQAPLPTVRELHMSTVDWLKHEASVVDSLPSLEALVLRGRAANTSTTVYPFPRLKHLQLGRGANILAPELESLVVTDSLRASVTEGAYPKLKRLMVYSTDIEELSSSEVIARIEELYIEHPPSFVQEVAEALEREAPRFAHLRQIGAHLLPDDFERLREKLPNLVNAAVDPDDVAEYNDDEEEYEGYYDVPQQFSADMVVEPAPAETKLVMDAELDPDEVEEPLEDDDAEPYMEPDPALDGIECFEPNETEGGYELVPYYDDPHDEIGPPSSMGWIFRWRIES